VFFTKVFGMTEFHRTSLCVTQT